MLPGTRLMRLEADVIIYWTAFIGDYMLNITAPVQSVGSLRSLSFRIQKPAALAVLVLARSRI